MESLPCVTVITNPRLTVRFGGNPIKRRSAEFAYSPATWHESQRALQACKTF